MSFELAAKTEAGACLVRLAEHLAEDLAAHAVDHDRAGTYPFKSFAALADHRYFTAAVPEEQGGLGVTLVHDVVVASTRLAHGDPAVAIGVNMHLQVALNILRRWQMGIASGNERRAAAFEASMGMIVNDGMVMAAAISEPGQDLTRPGTVATRTESGWRIKGRKIFCTMAPAATTLIASVRFTDDDGGERYVFAQIPSDAPGVEVLDDWDALGMRASGSNSVQFNGVELPAAAIRGGFPAGDPLPYMERNLTAGVLHGSSSLGIAEAADTFARSDFIERGHGVARAHTRMLAAENAVELSACRATLARAATLLDEHYAANPSTDGTDEQITALFAEGQAAKAFVNEAATRIVDRALALSGGAGYLSKSPLSRAYRDVRAGSFMHPLGVTRAYELLGHVSLGEAPTQL
ncbi:MAG: acyl-CoA/acyl-ACP dehydrogenase [Actinomycetia bacterium]|nr:acyl-CoA/acyl-ACP dehydrogenase [Actinomycetes bacterium]